MAGAVRGVPEGHRRDDGGIAAAVTGSLVIAAALGAVRALTMRVWRQDVVLHVSGTNGGAVGNAPCCCTSWSRWPCNGTC